MALTPESQALLEAHLARTGRKGLAIAGVVETPRGPRENRMNRWEADYEERMLRCRVPWDILWYAFEPVSLRLPGTKNFYRPDFLVIRVLVPGHADSVPTVEFHEVKGFLRDDARDKLKVAASVHPWATFKLATPRRIVRGIPEDWIVRPVQSAPLRSHGAI